MRTFMILLTAILGPLSLVAAESGEPVSVTIFPSANPIKISPLLFGTQYNFFSTPIRERIQDPSLLQTWKDMPVKLLRYPGGTWADHYLWDNPAGGYFAVGDAKSIVTPKQFVENCRAIGAEPIFQVNTSLYGKNGKEHINPTKLEDIKVGADRAARWVKEANIKNRWGIKYWEIGNEVWIWMTPSEYATFVREYAQAMKAVDPMIKIIACGLSGKVGPFGANWLKFPEDPDWKPRPAVMNNAEEWNTALAKEAAGSFDLVAPHIYFDSGDGEKSAEERYEITNVKILEGERLTEQLQMLGKMAPTTKLALTEWGCNFRQSVPVRRDVTQKLYYYSLGNGINTGLCFGKILEAGDRVAMAVLHSIDDIQTLWYWPKKELSKGAPLLHPPFLAMQLWGHYLGVTSAMPKVAGLPSLQMDGKSYPGMFVYASEDARSVYLVAINLDPKKSQELKLDGTAGIPLAAAGTCTWLSGDSLSAENFAAWNGAKPLEAQLKHEKALAANGVFRWQMPPHSMLGVAVPKRR